VAAREEQRALVERNLRTFDALDQRLNSIEGRVVETRQQRQAELAVTHSRSSELELKLQEADQELAQLREQLMGLYRENEQTRAAIDSGPLLRMLRDLESTQRDTSVLRGALEEIQREQQAERKRLQDYYLDLDARIQALQARERSARDIDLNGVTPGGDMSPEPSSTPGESGDAEMNDSSGAVKETGELGEEAGQLLDSFDGELQRQDIETLTPVPADALPLEVMSDDPAGAAAADSPDAVPDIINTIDTVPVMSESFAARTNGKPGSTTEVIREESMNHESIDAPAQGSDDPQVVLDNDDAREKAAGAAVQHVTAHGLIITDWAANVQGQTPGSPRQ
jgi:hypothetical protein